MSMSFDNQVRGKVVGYLFENIRAGAISTAVAGALLVLAIATGALPKPHLGVEALYLWYATTLLVIAYRMWLRKNYECESTDLRKDEKILLRFRIAAGLAGLCWGILAAICAFAENETYLVTLLVVGAMGVGAIPYLAADLRSYIMFLAGCVLPLVQAEIFAQPDRVLLNLSLIAVYSAGVAVAARNYSMLVTTSLQLRISSDRLTTKIEEANGRLEDELAQRKQVARQLQQARNTAESANRAKTLFLSRMSHELRTPLNAVLGFSELLSIMPPDELARKKVEYLAKISASGSHLLSLIEDILDITRIDTGQLRLSQQVFKVSDVLSESITMLEPKAAEHRVTVRIDPENDVSLSISTDRLRFRQILLNLISNAVKYNKPNGLVDISVRAVADQVRLEVRDTGIGIAQQDLGKAFEPFARLRNETGTIEGTGIGLTITKQLTEMMKGSITIDSSVDQGTSIVVELPRYLESASELRPTGT